MPINKIDNFKQQLNQIIDDITDELIIPLDLFKIMREHFANGKRKRYLKNSLLQMIGKNFLQSFVMAIGRQTDKRGDVLSLARFIIIISNDKKYKKINGVENYKNTLENLNKNIIQMRHKFIAHRNKDIRQNNLSINLTEIENAINQIAEISKGLYLIVNGGLITNLLPVKQFDENLLEIFK